MHCTTKVSNLVFVDPTDSHIAIREAIMKIVGNLGDDRDCAVNCLNWWIDDIRRNCQARSKGGSNVYDLFPMAVSFTLINDQDESFVFIVSNVEEEYSCIPLGYRYLIN